MVVYLKKSMEGPSSGPEAQGDFSGFVSETVRSSDDFRTSQTACDSNSSEEAQACSFQAIYVNMWWGTETAYASTGVKQK